MVSSIVSAIVVVVPPSATAVIIPGRGAIVRPRSRRASVVHVAVPAPIRPRPTRPIVESIVTVRSTVAAPRPPVGVRSPVGPAAAPVSAAAASTSTAASTLVLVQVTRVIGPGFLREPTRDGSTADFLLIEFLDGILRSLAILEAHEREAARLLGLVVPWHVYVADLAVHAEHRLQVFLFHGVIEVVELEGVEAGDVGRAFGTVLGLRRRGLDVVLSKGFRLIDGCFSAVVGHDVGGQGRRVCVGALGTMAPGVLPIIVFLGLEGWRAN